MNVSTAIKTARQESYMHRSGDGWVITTLSERHNAWQESQPCDWAAASGCLRRWKIERAAELCGVPDEMVYSALMYNVDGRWDAIVRSLVKAHKDGGA